MGRERATPTQAFNKGFSRGFVIVDDPYRVCAREELNLHAQKGHWHLKPARLPFRHSRIRSLAEPA